MLTLFNWSRIAGAGDAQTASWGHYTVVLRRRSSGAWELELDHGSKRRRHDELPAETVLAAARATAEQWLLDEQGPEIRELVRRARAAGSTTRSLRAAGGKRRQARPSATARLRHIRKLRRGVG